MRILYWLILLSLAAPVYSAPFETCPSKAYLFQANPVQVYGVNLVSGLSTLVQGDTGLDANINAVGFDFEDRYIYGYDTTNLKIVRLGGDFKAETLDVSGLPTYTFFVGDVYNHVYYLYRKNKGLFTIDLSPLDSNPSATLSINQVSDTATVSLTDFAFHPSDGSLYGVDNNTGYLYQFDPTTGVETYIGDPTQSDVFGDPIIKSNGKSIVGTFGAGYFDVNGYYYISRNEDGHIFRIDLSNPDNVANGIIPTVKFAEGPFSSQNDGARCANAPVIDEDSTIDFGDAPDSYLTLLDSNGARHEMDGITWLGNIGPDGEQDGLISPLNDNKAGLQDEDGVGFVTAIEAGLEAAVTVEASTSGYLSAWFDWNRDGDFEDAGEKVFSDEQLSAGSNNLFFTVSSQATMGSSWTRFRFSQQTGLDYYGGAGSGEVEDHPITITENGIAVRHFPSETGHATIAFEDYWPNTVDYDMNDVIMRYRTTETIQDGSVVQIKLEGYLATYGAGYHNGFAVRLQGINAADIDPILTRQLHNDVQLADSGLETDATEAIFIISNNLSDNLSEQCEYFRTLQNCKEALNFAFTLHIALKSGTDTSNLIEMPYDPFIFATPGMYHGDNVGFQPGRKWEVHLADQSPTEKFDVSLFGAGVDASSPNDDIYFKTSDNLPFALLVTDEWKWPLERVDLVNAYPEFAQYAESGGELKPNWHLENKATPNKIYQPE